jgi:hypothetical protein
MKIWLEYTFAFLRKPSAVRQYTTYYTVIEWKGRLTGTYYHMCEERLITGRFPETPL